MPNHIIVTGLAFGDEGKGTIVDYLARKAEKPLVVRYNGGSQAAHNVVTPDGKHHTFAQFGSGTLAGAPTHLSQFTILNPMNMVPEAANLQGLTGENPFRSTTVADGALIITPFHIAANRLRETMRGDERHGSCGQGIGETVETSMRFPGSALRAVDLLTIGTIVEKFVFWRTVMTVEMGAIGADITGTMLDPKAYDLVDMAAELHDAARSLTIVSNTWLETQFDSYDVIFEGAQGVLLDERLGFHPHTTWSKTTPHNARLLLGGRDAYHLGVTRAYTTRHGAGPFVTDMGSLGTTMFPEEHNGAGEFQGSFRVGAFDFLGLTYAADSLSQLGHKMDGIAVTHLDRIDDEVPACWRWEDGFSTDKIPTFYDLGYNEPDLEHQEMITRVALKAKPVFSSLDKRRLLDSIENELETDIVIESHGPTHEDKKDYR